MPRGRAPDQERYEAFAAALDALHRRVEEDLGERDVEYMRKVQRASRALEIAGRTLIHFSLEPASFAVGVLALSAHKQLETMEIGHTVLHGGFDRLPGATDLHADRFRWRTVLDERSWQRGHNLKHHPYTNVAGRDPDVRLGPVRLNDEVRHEPFHRHQILFSLLMWPYWTTMMGLNYAGVVDVYLHRMGELDVLPDKSWASVRAAHLRALSKMARYASREYGLFPLLAGPLWWKVALGNWLAGRARDLLTAATIYCNHIDEQIPGFPPGKRAASRGEWYAMQVEGTSNFEVPRLVSILSGAVDRHVEHHLFPRLPTNRLREIAPEVRRICEEHAVTYRSASLATTLARSFRRLARLSKPRHPTGY